MRQAARSSCVGAYASMGPCGPRPSCLHRALPATPGRPDRRVGPALDRCPPKRPRAAPRPPTPARRRCRPPSSAGLLRPGPGHPGDPRSEETRLNSSHRTISYAVFCLKKKTQKRKPYSTKKKKKRKKKKKTKKQKK